MSSKPKSKGGTELQTNSALVEAGEASLGSAVEIRRRAYEIYVEHGEQPGRDLDDWLQAERDLELDSGALSRAQAAS